MCAGLFLGSASETKLGLNLGRLHVRSAFARGCDGTDPHALSQQKGELSFEDMNKVNTLSFGIVFLIIRAV